MKPVNDFFGRRAAWPSKRQSLNVALGMVIAVISLTAFTERLTRAAASYDAESGPLRSARDTVGPSPLLLIAPSITAFSVNAGAIRVDIPPRPPEFSNGTLPTEIEAVGTARTEMRADLTTSSDPVGADKGSVIVHGSLSGSLQESEDAPWRRWLQ